MNVEVALPQWGMGMQEGVLTSWLCAVGDQVAEDDVIAEVEAEKSTGELVAPVAGVVSEQLFAEGDTVRVGATVAIITAN